MSSKISGLETLVHKFSTSGPRYTSYPTAPQFTETFGSDAYAQRLAEIDPSDTISLYVHIPFCESLCYYCGCNIQITKDHSRATRYIEALKKELKMVASALSGTRSLRQMSWGGGTPTFLTVPEIETLCTAIAEVFPIEKGADISVEIDPRVTSVDHLKTLRKFGFNRVSLGVQDFDPSVQKAVHRIQSEESTVALLNQARDMGFKGINFDLIYGLPNQTAESFAKTVDRVAQVRPDRIALFNYAHLPSMIPHQKLLDKYPMPQANERIALFLSAFDKLTQAGYRAIGLDHFAVPEDELAQAIQKGELYRNFQGYVARHAAHLIGIGTSAIGEIGDAYFQNAKKADDYEARIGSGKFATVRGIVPNDEDLRRKWIIQSLMCRFRLEDAEFKTTFGKSLSELYPEELSRLSEFVGDGVLEKTPAGFRVTELGRLFIRNVAMVFDEYLKPQGGVRFSQTV